MGLVDSFVFGCFLKLDLCDFVWGIFMIVELFLCLVVLICCWFYEVEVSLVEKFGRKILVKSL